MHRNQKLIDGMPLRHAVVHEKHPWHGLGRAYTVVGKVRDRIAVVCQKNPVFTRRPTRMTGSGRPASPAS